MDSSFTRQKNRAQVRDLPLFRFAASQDRRPERLSRAETTLRLRYGLSVSRAKLIAELQGYGGSDG